MQDDVERATDASELRSLIESRVKGLMADLAPDNVEPRKVAVDKHALLLCADMGGVLALRPSGEVISFRWDDPDLEEVQKDSRIRNLALFQGSKRYPELEQLVPLKPDDAEVCPYCRGTGIPPEAAGLDMRNIICYCGGLGWVT